MKYGEDNSEKEKTTREQIKPEEEKETENEIDASPIEQVRLTVPITDDPTLPVLTFRTWALGPITCALLAFASQFFGYRQNPVSLSGTCVQMLLVPLGKLMAATLPTKPVRVPGTKWTFLMNPGPFNIKEHVLLTTFATSGLNFPLGLSLVILMKAFYKKKINFLAAFLMTLTSQMLGYGFAGIFMKFLVNSPYMWWPYCLIDVSFYRAIHEAELRPKGQLTRFQFFLLISVSSFAYYIVPNYFFPSISALSFVCWIWKHSVIAQQIGSGRYGLGIGSFAIDWTAVSGFLGSPLAFPTFAIINRMVGFVVILYLIAPIAYLSNSYNAKRFPFSSYDLYDFDGQTYNVSRVLNEKDLKLNQQGYESYSKIYLSVVFLYASGLDFASLTAALTHFILFNGRDVWHQFRQAYINKDQFGDVHNKLMQKYSPIPQWWFYIILFSMLGLAIFACEGFGKQLQLPYWGVLLGCFMVLVLILPLGVLEATTGQDLSLNVISELIMGYIYPGKPLANVAFKAYGFSTMSQALAFVYDFKLAHYMKIPPKSMFVAQVSGTILSSTISFATAWWLFSTVDNICDVDKLPEGSPWTCPGDHFMYSVSIIWGVVGPSRIFAPHGLYSGFFYFFLIGVILPVLAWILSLLFPGKKWIRLVNIPIILAAVKAMPAAGAVNYWSWFTVGFLFNFIVYRKYKGWWAKYNYVLASGLDMGVAFMALLASLTLQLEGIYGVQWWGLEVSDHCPLAQCPTAPGVHVDGCPLL